MRLNLLLTGNELMTGDTIDSNSAMIAQRFAPFDWRVRRKLTVGDELSLLVDALRDLAGDCDVLLVNGGLGPTVDDLTAQALATACGVALSEHPVATAHLEQWCGARRISLNAANRKQALLPSGATVVPNPVGSAVGFSMWLGQCRVICTPGVPSELRAMLDETIIPELRDSFGAGTGCIRRFALFGAGESGLQQLITERFPDWPADVELGFRVSMPLLELKLACRSLGGRTALDSVWERLEPLIEDVVLGEGGTSMAARLIELLAQQGKRITCAESCTGGNIAAQLTEVPGASRVFDAGFVTYSNEMKEKVLGVRTDDLAQHGAVSEAVVLQMAAGALRVSGADLAVAVSGIAGPDGGTPEKPVGTVCIAWGSLDDLRACQLQVRFGRRLFQQYVATVALDLIRRRLQGITRDPGYLRRS